MVSNNAVIIKKYLDSTAGYPVIGEHLAFEKREFDLENAQVDEETPVLLKNIYTSVDPYLRMRMQSPKHASYIPPLELGKPFYNSTVAKVVKSTLDQYKPGMDVVFVSGWEEYTFVSKQALGFLQPINNPYKLPLIDFVGSLGMPSQTAYCGLKHIGKPKAGETIYISAASGAVGQMAGQLAKAMGLHVVGSVGSDEKFKICLDSGYDSVFNYKKESPFKALPRLCPKGIDIYFENVGGETMDAVLENMNLQGRIIFCGAISQYNNPNPYRVKNLGMVLVKSLTIQGFIVANILPQYQEQYFEEMPKLIAEGKIKYKCDVYDGLESAPEAFIGMLQGKNSGKTIVKIADE
ncbi:NADP-dependent oxidoreductase, implicated in cellular detoxification [Schizosaccharomyces pombe]|uniref:Zinc-type alcohol dehydrogenase-like protein PB24D3.08c n=1 Tax=Schizosaccharomyces pombe (strain 972 / ATCC 24843) TaxID=284812 RepID=YKM8_SCHPO|nr:putative NADP-dependent oxidoreductase [Schizosaccharomyces pombe]Q9C0Y6.1 RecName: Full=Zinc-type alcohol dehydrogenase-like protein PB24D3.08c [Schizosaccharomyces pombe 972h-]CAC36904.1 NADP-dependent oxidoreductase (predicted) [Schizosaccharomyces pombe]|eukprot:NP_593994.1 putative NADP-dependent oxidoreductase [Schizosaccharomyces pombe]